MLKNLTNIEQVANYLHLERAPDDFGWFKLVHHDTHQQCEACSAGCPHSFSTTFLLLLDRQPVQPWARFGATTIWTHVSGAPVDLSMCCEEDEIITHRLGDDFVAGHHPLMLINKGNWTKLTTLGDWSLLGVTFTPGLEFDKLEIAKKGWEPGRGEPTLSFPVEGWNAQT